MAKQTYQENLRRAWVRRMSRWPLVPKIRSQKKWQAGLAHHEVGHAVLYAICGFDINYVSIIDEADRDGYCQVNAKADYRSSGDVWIALSGVVAEARYLQCGIFSISPDTWRTDWRNAHERISADLGRPPRKGILKGWNDDPEMDTAIKKAFTDTRRLVVENWYLIERVAHALLERGRLDGDEVLHLCGRLSPLKPSAILAQKMVAL